MGLNKNCFHTILNTPNINVGNQKGEMLYLCCICKIKKASTFLLKPLVLEAETQPVVLYNF